MAWTFCSKEDVIAIHKVPISSLQDFWSEIAESFIRTHLGARYLGNSTELVEYYDGENSDTLIVKNPPISSVSSIYVNGSLIDPDSYLAGETAIWLLNSNIFPSGRRNIKVTYTSGTAEVSTEIRTACAIMVVAVSDYWSSLGSDTSLVFGSSEVLGGSTPNIEIGLVSHMKQIMYGLLRRYKVNVR